MDARLKAWTARVLFSKKSISAILLFLLFSILVRRKKSLVLVSVMKPKASASLVLANLNGNDWRRLAVSVHTNERQVCLRDGNSFVPAKNFDIDMNRYRRCADSRRTAVEADHLAHIYRRFELHFFHGNSDNSLASGLRTLHRTRQIDITQNDATKNCPLTIGVFRLQYYSYRWISMTKMLAQP